MKRVFANLEEDEDGRKVIRMGGECPVCGNGPDMKYAANGQAVLIHLPVECNQHLANWKARHARAKEMEAA